MKRTHEQSAYTYTPLPGKDFIRVLELKPSTHIDSRLESSFHIAQLDHDDYPYDAMSYTWGEPVLSQTLYIEATPPNQDSPSGGLHPIGVTPNLSKMLRNMRHPLRTRRLWVDALCINQQDDDEKSNQIPLMFRIYQQASRVVIWLGDNTKDQRRMRLLSIFARRRVRHDGPVSTMSPDELQAAQEAIYRLTEIRWFSRLWVVQEAVINTDVTMYCGVEEMSLVRLFDIVKDMHALSEHQAARLQSLLEMGNLWNQYARGHVSDISSRQCNGDRACPTVDIMERFEHFGCADPRDRVYAIATLQKCMKIVPDYRLSPEQVYFNFACSMRDHGQLQWVLREASIRQCGIRTSGLPSWVPDLRIRPIRRPIFTKNLVLRGEYLGDATDVSTSRQNDGSDAITLTNCYLYMQSDNLVRLRPSGIYTWHDIWERQSCESRQQLISARLRFDPCPMIATWRGHSFPNRPEPAKAKSWMKTTLELVWQQFYKRAATVSPRASERLTRKKCIEAVASTLVADGANIGDLHPNTSKEVQQLSDSIYWMSFSNGHSRPLTRCMQEVVEDTVDQGTMSDAFIQLVMITMQGRCFFTSDMDEDFKNIRAPIACGIGPSHLKIGDQVLLHYMPFWEQAYLVRAYDSTDDESPSCFELVGDCYLKEPIAGPRDKRSQSRLDEFGDISHIEKQRTIIFK